VAATADLVTTEIALTQGATEVNPLMKQRATRISIKAAAVALVLWIEHTLRKTNHPNAAKVVQWIATAFWGGAATWNTYMLHKGIN
jgi:hypothetical protein